MKHTVFFSILALLASSASYAADNITQTLEKGQSLSSAQQQAVTQQIAQPGTKPLSKDARAKEAARHHQEKMNQGKDHSESAR